MIAVAVVGILIFAIFSQTCHGVKVFRNTLDVSTPEPMVGGASIRNADNDVSVRDMTICLRFTKCLPQKSEMFLTIFYGHVQFENPWQMALAFGIGIFAN